MSVCKANNVISKYRITPQWLNRISGALTLVPIESTSRGVNRCNVNLMTNNVELNVYTTTIDI